MQNIKKSETNGYVKAKNLILQKNKRKKTIIET